MQSLHKDYAFITHSLRIHYAFITQFHYAALCNSLSNSLSNSITQLIYAEILKITRLRNGRNYADLMLRNPPKLCNGLLMYESRSGPGGATAAGTGPGVT